MARYVRGRKLKKCTSGRVDLCQKSIMAEKQPRVPLPEVELGFVESPEDLKQLTSPFFPSKVGGKPAWLDEENLPTPTQLLCDNCAKPLVFLLQVYAPINEDGLDKESHRTVFVFMCRDPKCHGSGDKGTKCFKVLCCQLPNMSTVTALNEGSVDDKEKSDLTFNADIKKLSHSVKHFHDGSSVSSSIKVSKSIDPMCTSSTDITTKSKPAVATPLCIVCGCNGPKFCGKCKRVNYCSREHQVHDWKSGHKLICSHLSEGKVSMSDLTYDPTLGVVLPELEIVTEVEPDITSLEKKSERSEEERMAEYLKFIKQDGKGRSDLDIKTLEDSALSEKKTDKQFRSFKQRVALEPEQVHSSFS